MLVVDHFDTGGSIKGQARKDSVAVQIKRVGSVTAFVAFAGANLIFVNLEDIVARTTDQAVISGTANKQVISICPVQRIVAVAPENSFIQHATKERIIAAVQIDRGQIDPHRHAAQVKHIIAEAALQIKSLLVVDHFDTGGSIKGQARKDSVAVQIKRVGSVTTLIAFAGSDAFVIHTKDIITFVAKQGVIPLPAYQRIVVPSTEQIVISVTAINEVVILVAPDCVVTIAPKNGIATIQRNVI